jgi:hypothetical protein
MAIQQRPQDAKRSLMFIKNKPGKVRKAKLNVNKSAPARGKAAATALKKKEVPSKRLLIFGGAVALVVVMSIYYCSVRRGAAPATQMPAAVSSSASAPAVETPVTPSEVVHKASDTNGLPSIRSIRLQPPHPTRMDTLKAEIMAEAPDPTRIKYTYVWKVNNRIIAGATGDKFNLSALKKADLINVTVTPYDGDKAGHAMRSPFVAVHNIAPTLDLQTGRKAIKAEEPLEFQLVSVHPDSESVTFSLEPPIVPGMSIDARSGKITWIRRPDQKGTIRFGAAVEDKEKTKVKKTFDINVE